MNSVESRPAEGAHAIAAEDRIAFLDGLRGLAILLVLLFHAYARWPALMPYHDRFARVPVFAHGDLGVQLFFLISGFVILMTLERTSGWLAFMGKRWWRLFPAMLMCSLLVFATAGLLPERPAGQPTVRSLLPGLTFIEPDAWASVLGGPQDLLEGAFWSLFVEMKFYVIAGAFFYGLGERWMLTLLIGPSLLCLPLLIPTQPAAPDGWLVLVKGLKLLGFQHYIWFGTGALAWRLYRQPTASRILLVVALALVAAATLPNASLGKRLVAAALALTFLASLRFDTVRWALQQPALLLLGFVSYPLYLMHENFLVAVVIQLHRAWPALPAAWLPIPVGVVAVAIAYSVARLEGRIRSVLRGRFTSASTARRGA